MDFRFVFISFLFCLRDVTWAYLVGVGRADVTGPIVEVTLMGYGKFSQKGTGLHLRQWSRAYIIGDQSNRLVFVNVDAGMMADGVRIQVIKLLEEKFEGIYNKDNVIISATHTHSGVGGFMMHTFFDIPTGGFCKETFNALVGGIVKSIEKAHNNLQEGRVFLATDTVLGVTVNRSPTSYLENPEAERARYTYDTDKELVQLRLENKSGKVLGLLNWYPIHGTTLNNTNTLVSTDNVGYASVALEKTAEMNDLVGQTEFVGSFASSNLGDVSPNVRGPRCHTSGTECDIYSKCADMFEECYSLGPSDDMYESMMLIGSKLSSAAWNLMRARKGQEVTGPVKAIHQYVDMTKATARVFNRATGNTEQVRGCQPAMGYSAGAGTTDGPFLPFLRQGLKNTSWWVDALTHVIARPTREEIACHAPKPILLASSHLGFPFEWQPRIVSTQLGRIGNVAIVCVPGEFTTMAGRRMRDAIQEIWGVGTNVIIAGLCNTYSDYITTFEEYQAQRYEAASTLFGPHTLNLHLSQYKTLARALTENEVLEAGPEPKGLDSSKMFSLISPVLYDSPKKSHNYGDVLVQPVDLDLRRNKTVRATFVGANPRNNPRLDDTYLLVEEKLQSGEWYPVANDADASTILRWRRTNVMKGTSEVDIEWTPLNIPNKSQTTYRIRYFGDYKSKGGKIRSFEGVTEPFTVRYVP